MVEMVQGFGRAAVASKLWRLGAALTVAVAAATFAPPQAFAQTLLDGSFESPQGTNSSGLPSGTIGTTSSAQALMTNATYGSTSNSWQVNSTYTFVLSGANNSAAFNNGTSGSPGSTIGLFGPVAHSTTSVIPASPNGGYYLASDGNFNQGAIYQTVTNLVAGNSYVVSFYWGGSQQIGFTGTITDSWMVGFLANTVNSNGASSGVISTGTTANGTSVQSVTPVTISNQSFSGWTQAQLQFTASATSMVLSFLAIGAPSGGQPPFSLLDGVTVAQAVPEPVSAVLLLSGLAGVIVARRGKRSKG